jgi:hypothetical protein
MMIALLLTLALAADEAKPKLPPETQRIIDLARPAAPEIFADTVIRLIEAGRISRPEWQIDLLEQAFAAASSATEPVRLIALPATPPDTRELYRARAGDLGLDALALQSRVLTELVTVDRARARELFGTIHRPALDPRPCEDPLVADASAYYEIAALIAQSYFTREEKRARAHVQFLAALLDGLRSPNELASFLKSLHSVSLDAGEWDALAEAFAAKLGAVHPDYRPFALSFESLQSEVQALAQISHSPDLAPAFRRFTVTQLTARRCSPDLSVSPEMPLEPKEITPSARDASLKTSDPYFADQAAFSAAMRDYAAFQPSGDDTDVLHQRGTVLGALLQSLRSGDDRDHALQLAAEMLARSGAQEKNPAEWMWEVRHLTELAGGDSVKLLADFRATGNAALIVTADLSK